MREIQASEIKKAIVELIYQASYTISPDIDGAIRRGIEAEISDTSRNVLEQIAQSYQIARDERIAICQDTGMAVFFIELGQDVHVTGGGFEETINDAVREAYREGYLRKSVVAEPMFDRVNTKDNTPAVIHTRIVPGEQIHTRGRAQPLPAGDRGRGRGRHVRTGRHDCQAHDRARRGLAQRRPALRGARGRAARRDQPPGHRPGRHRRRYDRAGGQHRLLPDAHRRHAGGRQHVLPLRAAR